MMKRKFHFASSAFSVVLFLAAAMQSSATLVTVNFDSGSSPGYTMTNFNGTTPLTGGTATDGNGAVLQLGYFSSGTSSTPFAGTWVALTGQGGANSAFSTTSIGDATANGAGTGTFAMSLSFNTAVANTTNSLPTAGTPLGFRIYNNTTIASSTFYETISSTLTSWQWQTPADAPFQPILNLTLDDPLASLRRENGTGAGAAATATFNTNLSVTPVPEVSTFAFGVLVALTAAGTRRRREMSQHVHNHPVPNAGHTKFVQ